MPRKGRFIAASIIVLTMVLTPSAQALFASGACAFTLTFDFDTRVRSATSTLTAPTYEISGGAPIDPLGNPCVIPIVAPDPLKDTGMVGFGNSTIWTCESVVAGGSWNQSWEGAIPAIENGSHKVAGTWGAWTMALSDLNPPAYVGAIELTVHPDDALKASTCMDVGIRSLKMIGVMVFQDP